MAKIIYIYNVNNITSIQIIMANKHSLSKYLYYYYGKQITGNFRLQIWEFETEEIYIKSL